MHYAFRQAYHDWVLGAHFYRLDGKHVIFWSCRDYRESRYSTEIHKNGQKRVNGVLQTTHFPSYCSWRVKNSDTEQEAVKLCEKVSLSNLTIHSNVENDMKSHILEPNPKMFFTLWILRNFLRNFSKI